MKNLINNLTRTDLGSKTNNIAMLVFRVLVSCELMLAHGLKKIGVGTTEVEIVPNPLHLPEIVNSFFASAANLFFPLFIIAGFITRLAALPIIAVTATGYFVVHRNDTLLIKDTPFMYSVCFVFIAVVGAGKYSIDYAIIKQHPYKH